jgi:hypothetical protein
MYSVLSYTCGQWGGDSVCRDECEMDAITSRSGQNSSQPGHYRLVEKHEEMRCWVNRADSVRGSRLGARKSDTEEHDRCLRDKIFVQTATTSDINRDASLLKCFRRERSGRGAVDHM